MYTPSFKCKFCDKPMPVATTHCGNEGLVIYCGCNESLKDWETKHRAEIERRKTLRRRGTR